MQQSTFENLVHRFATSQEDEDSARWEERRIWWQNKVGELETQVKEWLRPLIDSGTIKFSQWTVRITEETLGTYSIPTVQIELRHRNLWLRPIGSVIVGGFGRINVDGPAGNAMLILTNERDDIQPDKRRAEAEWFIAHPKRPTELRILTRESFEQLFTDLFGISE